MQKYFKPETGAVQKKEIKKKKIYAGEEIC